MRRVFLNPELNDLFRKKGYIILDLLDENVCAELMALFEKNHDIQPGQNFFTTHRSPVLTYRKLCNDVITACLTPYMQGILDYYLPLFGNFMVKPAGNNSECDFHQDWTFVDENNFRTVNVWVALRDMDVNNGCIHISEGSHNLPLPIRGRKIHPVYYDAIPEIIRNLLIPIPLKKGQCIIFDSAIFHYSPINKSDKTRVAASLMFYPAEASLVHYVDAKENHNRVIKYNVNPEFFVDFSCEEDYFSPVGDTEIINHPKITFDSIKAILCKLSE